MAKTKLTLSVANDLSQRLDFEAAVTGKDRSAIVNDLILNHIVLPADWADLDTLCSQEAKASPRQPTPAAKRAKTTFYVSAKASMVLGVHAGLTRSDRSDILGGLIRNHVTPWKAYDESKHHTSAFPTSRRKRPAEINSSDSAAA
jgi:hypothetical protein